MAIQPLLRLVLLGSFASVATSSAHAKDTWVEIRSPHFLVVSNAGEGAGRKIADQFEQFREVFQSAFPKMRVDLGKPLIIFALKNEDSMKQLIPEYWEVKGHVHPDGLYVPGEDTHSVVLRTDVQSENPYQVMYHEYTHALMNLNFAGLPVWLGEGLAEFFGNSTLRDKDTQIGQIARYHLQILQQSRLIPIDVLLQADHNSPYYNEQNRASVFYAESWAIVHYLMLDPEARKKQLLQNFLVAWDASGNQVEAAQKTFGDLKKFGTVMEAYARQSSFYVAPVKTAVHADAKSFTSRPLSLAEAEAYRGEFFVRTNRLTEARTSLDLTAREDPNLALGHEGLGLLAIRQQKFDIAESEFARAIALNSANFVVYYYSARALFRSGLIAPADSEQAIADLEKATQLNPQFAPAFSALASAYSTHPEFAPKAIAAGRKATELEPGNISYVLNFGYVLLNAGKIQEAKILSGRLLAAARTAAEVGNAMEFSSAVTARQAYAAQMAAAAAAAREQSAPPPTLAKTETAKQEPPSGTISVAQNTGAPPVSPGSTSFSTSGYNAYALEGQVASINCAKALDGLLGLRTHSVLMEFHYRDIKDLKITAATSTAKIPDSGCASWKGRRVRLTFFPTPEHSYDGELVGIQFF